MIDLRLGDCENILPDFKDKGDVVIIDPPYGIGNKKLSHKAKNWNKSDVDWDQFDSVEHQYQSYLTWLGLCKDCMKETGNLFVFGSFHSIYLCGEIIQRQLGMKIVNSICWEKINAMFSITQSSLIEGTEHIIWAVKSKDYFFNYEASKRYTGKQLRNVWRSSLTPEHERARLSHPHQKPVWIMQRLLEIGCPPKGFVIDPMSGSGTTAATCQGMGLEGLFLEKNKAYFEALKGRLADSASIFETER